MLCGHYIGVYNIVYKARVYDFFFSGESPVAHNRRWNEVNNKAAMFIFVLYENDLYTHVRA